MENEAQIILIATIGVIVLLVTVVLIVAARKSRKETSVSSELAAQEARLKKTYTALHDFTGVEDLVAAHVHGMSDASALRVFAEHHPTAELRAEGLKRYNAMYADQSDEQFRNLIDRDLRSVVAQGIRDLQEYTPEYEENTIRSENTDHRKVYAPEQDDSGLVHYAKSLQDDEYFL